MLIERTCAVEAAARGGVAARAQSRIALAGRRGQGAVNLPRDVAVGKGWQHVVAGGDAECHHRGCAVARRWRERRWWRAERWRRWKRW